MQQTPEFKNGMTAGIVLAVAQMIRWGNESFTREIINGAGITPNEDLSFCADYDLAVLREMWPEFEGVFGDDAETEQVWKRDDERTIITTLLVSDHHFNGPVTPERVAKWSDKDCQAVEDYCRAIHIHASDNDDYPVPPKPAVLGVQVLQFVTKNSPLHRRAAAILAVHGDQLQDQSRLDDLVFLNATVRRHRVFGNEKEQQRLDVIEAEFPLSDIQLAQLDPDVNCMVIPNRT